MSQSTHNPNYNGGLPRRKAGDPEVPSATERMREWRAKNPEKVKAANAARGWTERDRETKKKRYARDPCKHRMYQKARLYKLTKLEIYTLRKMQNNRCAICGEEQGPVKRGRGVTHELSIDHDHETGAIRGLLCHHCNAGLGAFRDDARNLKRGIEYLERHSADP